MRGYPSRSCRSRGFGRRIGRLIPGPWIGRPASAWPTPNRSAAWPPGRFGDGAGRRYPAAMASDPIPVLFIGNSFIARNDLPGQVAALAATADRRITATAITAGGASLRRHLNSGAIDAALARDFEVIVLQEQSTLPVRNAARYHANVRDVVAAIASAGVAPPTPQGRQGQPQRPRILLYETWARLAEPASQAGLTAAVATIGAALQLEIAPAGQAWQRVLAGPEPIILHDRDGSHPNPAGSFLAAAVITLAIFPADLDRIAVPDDNRLDPGVAIRLLNAARDLMRLTLP